MQASRGKASRLAIKTESQQVLEDEVVQFVVHETGYRVHTASGLRLDVMRAESLQPDIPDADDFHTWLWVEAFQGFFLLRQRVVGSRPGSWHVVRQYVPVESYGFFFDYLDVLRTILTARGDVLPIPPAGE